MKTESNFRRPRRRFGRTFIICLAVVSALCACELHAGLISVNFTDTTASGIASDGPGALGAGTWNRIRFSDAAGTNNLFDSSSVATGATLSQSSGGPMSSVSQGNGNPVQNETWGNGSTIGITVTGLVPNQIYKVVIYSDKKGLGDPVETYVVNGLGKSLPNPGVSPSPLPGTENIDYAVFVVNSSGAGQIVVTAPVLCGMQIQGVLAGEAGPQMDCRIAKNPNATGGKGNGVYELKNSKSQTLSQKVKGNRAAKYYVNVENDGAEIDDCYLMGFWKNRHFKKVRIKDRATGANVTAAALSLKHRFVLDSGATKSFFVKAKRAKQRSGKTSLQVCASPSTLVPTQQDCVTALMK